MPSAASQVGRRRCTRAHRAPGRRRLRTLICEHLEDRRLLTGDPDIALTSFAWNTLRDFDAYGGWRGVDVHYRVTLAGEPLPATAELSFFWASGPTKASALGDSIADRPVSPAGGSFSFNDPAFWGVPPQGTTHLLVVADPSDLIHESDETNNLLSLRVHTAAEILNGAVSARKADSATVTAEFRPGSGQISMSEAEVALGVHHFNWVSQVYLPPSMEVRQLVDTGRKILATNPFLDPPTSVSDLSQLELFSTHASPGAEPFGSQAVDGKLFYWNEPDQYSNPSGINLDVRDRVTSQGLSFYDSPRVPDGFYQPGESTGFYLQLMGVSSEGNPVVLDGASWLHWRSNATYQRGPQRGAYFIADEYDALPPVLSGGILAEPQVVSVDSPIARDDVALAGQRGPAVIDVLANDRDPLGGTLRILEAGRASHGTVAVSDGGTPGDPTDDVLLYTPQAGFVGEDRFQYVVVRAGADPGFAAAEVTVRVPGPIVGLAVAGDDLSDEYAGQPHGYARSWVELLAAQGVNVGAGALYAEPRGAGYEFNWARAGATSQALLDAGQHTGAAQQASGGAVNYAVLAVGRNDFAPGSAAYDGIYSGAWTESQIVAHADGVVSRIATAVDALTGSGASAVLVNIADPGAAPAARQAYPDAAGRERVAQAVAAVNQRLQALADRRRAPMADAFGFSQALFGTHQAPLASFTLGGETIVGQAGAEGNYAFVADGSLWHTVPQALLANLVLTALDLGYGADVSAYWLSEAEIAAFAGLSYAGDTFSLDLADFVALPPANHPPLPADDQYTADEDSPLVVSAASGVLANDADLDGQSLLAVLATGAAHGEVTIAPDGSFRYVPVADYHGPDEFTYAVDDGQSAPLTATVHLTVRPVNDPPVAAPDAYFADEDAPLSIDAAQGVLLNDSDIDGDSLTALLVAGPSHGALTLGADGSFTYTPAKDYNGPDGFTYRARDPALASSGTVAVSLTVRPANDPPVGQPDAYSTNEDTPLSIDAAHGVLLNDSDIDGDLLTALLVAGPSHGALTLGANGSFTYNPAKDYNGPDSFTYQAGDGGMASGTVTVSLTVRPVNDRPAALADAYATDEDVPLSVDALLGVRGNDSDVDGNALTVSRVAGPSHGALTLSADGSFLYVPAADYNGPDEFTYAVTDGLSTPVSAAVRLTVRPVSDPPDAADDDYFLDQGATLVVDAPRGVLANDRDRDGNGLAAQWVAGPANGELVLNPDGSYRYTPAPGFFGADSFAYQAKPVGGDAGAVSSTAFVTLNVARALGAVDFRELNGLSPSLGDVWLRLETVRGGRLTAEAIVAGNPADARLTLYTTSRQPLAVSTVREGKPRLDYTAGVAGAVYYLRVDGIADDVDLKLVNLVQTAGTVVTVAGTPGNDVFVFEAALATGQRRVTINSVQYDFAATAAAVVRFDGGDDADRAALYGGTQVETARLYAPGSTNPSSLTGSGYSVTVANTAQIAVYGQANDTAFLYASPLSTNTFSAYPTYAVLGGTGFSNRVNGFGKATAYATSGGKDVAYFFQSAGDDVFEGRPTYAFLSGAGFLNRGENFRYVYSRPTTGSAGRDTATLYGSTGSDSLSACWNRTVFSSAASSPFYFSVEGYEQVVVQGQGGADTARLYDSSGADTFEAGPSTARLFGDGFDNRANNFQSVAAYATSGGSDVARLQGSSTAVDSYVATAESDRLSGTGYLNTAFGFETVQADGKGGGDDVARLYDSPANDVFEGRPTWSSMTGGGLSHTAANFRYVYAFADKYAGDVDTAKLYDSPGTDTFLGYSTYARFYGPGFEIRPYAFASVTAFSQNGGGDVASLYDSAGDDTFESRSTWAAYWANNGSFSNRAEGFSRVVASRTAGGRDKAHFYYASAADYFQGRETYSLLRSYEGDVLKRQHQASNFDEVFAHGADVGYDRGYLYDSAGSDALTTKGNEAKLTYASGRVIHLLDLSWVYAKSTAGTDTKRRDPSTQFTLVLDPARPWIDV